LNHKRTAPRRMLAWITGLLNRGIRAVLDFLGFEIRRVRKVGSDSGWTCPSDAAAALRSENAELIGLKATYAALDLPVCNHSRWDDAVLQRELSLPSFRADNAYVWQTRQLRDELHLKQYIILRYVESVDQLNLLDVLEEDGAFDCLTYRYGDRGMVSRDLLDSVNEINFLDRQLGVGSIPDLKVLDIGAGYGRLAHRMCGSLANLRLYDCVDAVAESSFLCDFYIKYRGVEGVARSIPLQDFAQNTEPEHYHLAVNVHSFSECTIEAVRWWVARVAALGIPHLLVVPNDKSGMYTTEVGGEKHDFLPDILAAGYKLKCEEPVYGEPEVRELVRVYDNFFLFERVE